MKSRSMQQREHTLRQSAVQTSLHNLMRDLFAAGCTRDDLLVLLASETMLILHDDLRQFAVQPK